MIKNSQNIIGKNMILPDTKLDIIKWNLYERRVPLKNLFEDYDKLKKSKIPKTRFKAILNNQEIRMSERELEDICKEFAIDGDFIDYKRLIREVEMIRISEQEKNNIKIKCSNKLIYEPEEEKEVKLILQEIAKEIYLKRLSLKENFKDFDHLNSGHISKIQFFRVLHKIMKIDIKREKEDLIIRKYLDRDNTKEMNYFKFLNDIKLIIEKLENKENQENLKNENYPEELTPFPKKSEIKLESVFKKINKECRLYGKDIKYFFKDYDPLRKNYCNVPKFEHCLSLLNFNLAKEELDLLINNYKFVENCCEMINYKQMISDLKNSESNCETKKINKIDFSDIEHYFLQIKNIQKTKNFMFKQFCQDFDKNNRGEVTVSQFKRILNNYELMSNESKETQKLIDYFRKGDNVNYIAFLKKLEEINSENYRPKTLVDKFKIQDLSNLQKKFEDKDLVNLFMKMLKTEIFRKTIYEYHLKTFDDLNSGTIPTSSFFSGLGLSGLILSFEEMSLLKHFYENDNKINYRSFLINYKEFKKETNLAEEEINADKGDLTALMKELKFILDSRKIDLKMYFKNWDRFKTLKIPKNKFQQVLSLMNINLSKKDVELILEKYQNKNDNQSFDYNLFLNDLDLEQNKLLKKPLFYKENLQEKSSEFIKKNNSNDVFEILVKKLITHRIGLKNYFQDYDLLSKGYIKKEEFICVLDKIANISVIPNFQNITEKYMLENNFLNYIRFLEDVAAFSKSKNYQKIESDKITLKNDLSQQENTELGELLKEIKNHNKSHRLLLKSYFKDEDKSNRGLVYKDKVRSLLDRLGVKFTDSGFALLSKAFSRNELEFDYLQFIKFVEHN
jgi:Ca2+-binding EF-hand superfamily protein